MSFISGRSTLFQSAVVGGALVGALASASSASAALGTGPAATFTNRPNLQSVTFDGTGIIGAFKFDRPITLGAGGTTNFKFGSYRSTVANSNASATAVNVSTSDPTTVLVTYNGGTPPTSSEIPDFDNQSFGAVAAGAVMGNGTQSQPNLADATRVTGANGESGTRGHTAGPDLQSVIVDSDQNRIIYTFDELVDQSRLAGAVQSLGFTDANGNQIRATGLVGASGGSVIAQFPTGQATDVDNAREAFYSTNPAAPAAAAQGAISERGTQGKNVGAPQVSVPVPGRTDSTTVSPKLLSAQLEVDSGTVVYTFDQSIAGPGGGIAPANFLAVESNGDVARGTGAVITGGNSVRVTFNSSQFTEHLVFASVTPGAVNGVNANNNGGATASTPGGKPIGGNAGAKQTGYTTAPDALNATFNRTTGQVTVLFDSRFSRATTVGAVNQGVNPAGFQLLTSEGNPTGGTPSSATADTSTVPAQSRVILQYSPEQLRAAAAIRIQGLKAGAAAATAGTGFGVDTVSVVGTISEGTGNSDPAGVPFLFDGINVETLLTPSITTRSFAQGSRKFK